MVARGIPVVHQQASARVRESMLGGGGGGPLFPTPVHAPGTALGTRAREGVTGGEGARGLPLGVWGRDCGGWGVQWLDISKSSYSCMKESGYPGGGGGGGEEERDKVTEESPTAAGRGWSRQGPPGSG